MKKPYWIGPLVTGTDEQKVLAQLDHNCAYWKSDRCKRMTLENYCAMQGVTDPAAVIDRLIKDGVLYEPQRGYVAKVKL